MRLAVIGAGYVGLVTGACLAGRGHSVTVVENDATRMSAVREGRAPFYEPGLDELLRSVLPDQLRVTADLFEAVSDVEVVMIAVGTPNRDGVIDLTQLELALSQVGKGLAGRTDRPVVVVKSTVVPGTTDQVLTPILEEFSGLKAGSTIGIAVNPEFLTEGRAVADFEAPDRVVIGAKDQETAQTVSCLYSEYEAPVFTTSPSTAEMIKYVSNTLLATLVSFSNEIAGLSAAIDGVDVAEVMPGVHASRYLTTSSPEPSTAEIASFLLAGVGYGGSCLPKDTQALVAWGESLGVEMPLLRAVEFINQKQPTRVVQLTAKELGGLRGRAIGVLGLSFKPGTDDVRESPAFPIIRGLLAEGANVTAHDPMAIDSAAVALGETVGLTYETDLKTTVRDMDALVLVTTWDEYRALPELIAELSQPPLLVDGRRFIDSQAVPRYAGVGL